MKDITNLPGYLSPDQRPLCRLCRKRLRPVIENEVRQGEHGLEFTPLRVAYYGYDGRQLFCSLRCGYAYGCKAAKHKTP